jgi:hypothetical protein
MGTVLEVLTNRAEGAKWPTTVIKVVYMVGDSESTKTLNLQVLKSSDPTAAVVPLNFGIPRPPTPPPVVESLRTAQSYSTAPVGADLL